MILEHPFKCEGR